MNDPLVDAICGQLLEAMIEDTVGKMKIQQRSQSQSVSGGISGLPVDSRPHPVPGIISTSPAISNETPSSVPCTSPKSRAKVDMMQTAFDISSESSDEGMYVRDFSSNLTFLTPPTYPCLLFLLNSVI